MAVQTLRYQAPESGDISILLGNGDGSTFQPPVNYRYGTPPPRSTFNVPILAGVGDFNGSGHPDLLINIGFGTPTMIEMINNGDGTFHFAPGPNVQGAGPIGDFNGDGHLDIALGGVAIYGGLGGSVGPPGNGAILEGNGDGTFKPPIIVPLGPNVTAGDVNHSGRLSLVIPGGGLPNWSEPSIAVVLNEPDPVSLAFKAPGQVTAGVPFSATISALDASGQPVGTYRSQMNLSSTDPAETLLPQPTLTHGTRTFQLSLTRAGTQTLAVTDPNLPGLQATSVISVAPGALDHFQVSLPESAMAGDSTAVTVTAVDSFGNTLPDYSGQVHFTSTDATALLPSDSTLVNGTGTFSITLHTAGQQNISASDVNQSTLAGTSLLAVSPAPLDHFDVGVPAAALAGESSAVTVTARDAFGNLISDYSGSLAGSSSDATAVLPATISLSGGAGNFSVTFNSQGSQSVSVSDGAPPPHTGAAALAVSPASAFHYGISVPANATAGGAFMATVTVLDASNNPFIAYTGTVHFGSSDSKAVLPADAALLNGVGTFSVTLKTAGLITIRATDTAQGGLTSTSPSINVAAAAVDHLGMTIQNSSVAGTDLTATIAALDAYGNPATSYNGNVRFSSTDPAAVLPGITSLGSAGLMSAGADDQKTEIKGGIEGKVKKVDVDGKTLTITTTQGRDRTFSITNETTMVGPRGGKVRRRLHDPRFHEGLPVTIVADGSAATEVHLGYDRADPDAKTEHTKTTRQGAETATRSSKTEPPTQVSRETRERTAKDPRSKATKTIEAEEDNEIPGKVKRFDATRRILVVTLLNGTDRSFLLARDVPVLIKGTASKHGLEDPALKAGAAVEVVTDEGGHKVKELKIVPASSIQRRKAG
jgi:hypothetical protein